MQPGSEPRKGLRVYPWARTGVRRDGPRKRRRNLKWFNDFEDARKMLETSMNPQKHATPTRMRVGVPSPPRSWRCMAAYRWRPIAV